jgi:hypothetical protein
MSWVLVAWDGPVPTSAVDASRIFEQLESSTAEDALPTDGIHGYVEELIQRWPDTAADGGEDSPWADGPLIGDAHGPLFVFSLRVSTLEESIPYCTDVARRRGIVLFDPEQEEVYSPAGIPSGAAPPVSAAPSRRRFFRRK